MNRIKTVRIINFQSHEDSTLEFAPGMNVILGPSDSGKTAIFRAMSWCLFNEPSGTYFIREGAQQAEVHITFDDELTVSRIRSKSVNRYILTKDGQETTFEGFGKGVPQEVQEAVGIHKVYLDDKTEVVINFSNQLEGPFLLNENDSSKAQAIGRLVGVHIIDETMRETLRDRKGYTQKLNELRRGQELRKKQLEGFEYLSQWEQNYGKLEETLDLHGKKSRELENCRRLKAAWEANQAEGKDLRTSLLEFQSLTEGAQLLPEIKVLQRDWGYLLKISQRQERLQGELLSGREEVRKYESLEAGGADLSRAREELLQYRSLKPLEGRLGKNLGEQEELRAVLKDSEKLHEAPLLTSREKLSEMEKLRELQGRLKEVRLRLEKGRNYLQNFDHLEELPHLRGDILQGNGQYLALKNILLKYRQLRVEIVNLEDELQRGNLEMTGILEEYRSTLRKLKICPLCHQAITEEHMEEIERSL
ncbi:MAG: AAA family ATPase [Tissierellia bacterium]|nr:AAA family ATPase [Tissierellia bacterium]